MTVRLLVGDAQHLDLEDESVDAIVCDPPYGLEFMGKEWDAPWESDPHVGKRMNEGWSRVEMADGADRLRRPSYEKQSNVRCRTCNRWRLSSNPCRCERPDFPNLKAANMRAFQEWSEGWAREALRVLKPGGHMLAFGGTRTFHRLTSGLEDAGFEIRDCLSYMYGSGFPKSLNVAKAIDSGGRPEDVRRLQMGDAYEPSGRGRTNYDHGNGSAMNGGGEYEPSEAAAPWGGWGTALKPAWEPIVLARKPLRGTVAQNVAAFGTGALNIDGTRIGTENTKRANNGGTGHPEEWRTGNKASVTGSESGRWPANVVLDEAAAALLDASVGERTSGFMAAGTEREGIGYHGGLGTTVRNDTYGDSGGPSRFFYTSKASRSEREAGLDDLEPLGAREHVGRDPDSAGARNHRAGAGRGAGATSYKCALCGLNLGGGRRVSHCPESGDGKHVEQAGATLPPRRNNHPTVKPLDLMRWLVTLVTPPGGVVLDQFMGSGSTGVAAVELGFSFIGIDRDPHYVEIARRRITHERPMRMALGDAAL